MQKRFGKRRLALAIMQNGEEATVVDTPSQLGAFPPGTYNAVLLQRAPIPANVRRELKGHDLFKAI